MLRWLVVVTAGCGRVAFEPLALGNATDARSIDVAPTPLVNLDFSDLAACASISLVGDADCGSAPYAELNPDVGDTAGALYLAPIVAFGPTTQLQIHAVLEFVKASPNPPGDGAVIVVQADPRASGALGGAADMGFDGITPSIGVELDTFDDTAPIQDPDDNHSAIIRDGVVDTPIGSVYSLPFPMTNGGRFHVWIDYDATQSRIAVSFSTLTTKPAIPALTGTESLTRLGSALIGVVSGSAFAVESHRIHSIEVVYTP